MIATALSAGVVVALAALVFLMDRKMGVVLDMFVQAQARETPEAAAYDDTALIAATDRLWQRTKLVEEDIVKLTAAVAHGIEHVDRNEKRVRGIVVGAHRRFENSGYADPGVDAEEDSLPELDAPGSDGEPLHLVQEDLENAGRDPWDGVPGGGHIPGSS